jgi:hypothetical protein
MAELEKFGILVGQKAANPALVAPCPSLNYQLCVSNTVCKSNGYSCLSFACVGAYICDGDSCTLFYCPSVDCVAGFSPLQECSGSFSLGGIKV